MLNSRDRSGEKLRQHIEEAAEARRLAEVDRARAHASARDQRDRFEAEERKALEAIHAEYVAAAARQRDPSLFSWRGAVTALIALMLIGGIFLIATYLGN